MKVVVCALAKLDDEVRRRRPDGVVSLLSPDQPKPAVAGNPRRLVLRFNDVDEPKHGLIAPDAEAIIRLLDFGADLQSNAVVLLHCWMGISRSPAAAFILGCTLAPETPEADIARALRRAAPSATPNPLLVRLADGHLGRNGRMIDAIEAIGRGREARRGTPFELDTDRMGASP